MRRSKFLKKTMLSASLVLAGGMLLSGGCLNLLASTNLCGTVFTFCEPVDQINALYPLLEVPDFDADPSCTIPLGCGGSDVLPPLEGGPGGGDVTAPTDTQGGGLGGAGGGGI